MLNRGQATVLALLLTLQPDAETPQETLAALEQEFPGFAAGLQERYAETDTGAFIENFPRGQVNATIAWALKMSDIAADDALTLSELTEFDAALEPFDAVTVARLMRCGAKRAAMKALA